jgi:hypothetical protein
VVEVNIKLGRRNDEHGNFLGYPVFYLAYSRPIHDKGWKQLSEHKRLSAAKKQCEYFDAHGETKQRQTKAAKALRRGKLKRKMKKALDNPPSV